MLVGGKHAQAHISSLAASLHFYQIMLKHVLIHSPPEALKFTSKAVIKIFQTSCARMAFNYLVPLHCINACSLNPWFQFTVLARWTFAWLEAWEEFSPHLSTAFAFSQMFKCSFGEQHESPSSGHLEAYQQSLGGTFAFQFINLCP